MSEPSDHETGPQANRLPLRSSFLLCFGITFDGSEVLNGLVVVDAESGEVTKHVFPGRTVVGSSRQVESGRGNFVPSAAWRALVS